ncbi:MAG TPA: 16S rRNA (adenine(1518)-N(6)/adenine(1519)-N(6))-dimethyltransferase RsmA [Verrucomicrobiae bacterium]|nr:16S rRNA (adenine(1518)-N(6)/adenine(1519)-N(6))-dimethyltransferase RsmA [Verrucomicrobiae bacterium]
MRQLLASEQIQLTKALGQNFLHDGNQLRRIVTSAELVESDQVLEIGPGLGPLTELLLAGAGHVLAIEKDERLVKVLRRRFVNQHGLELIHADAMDFVREPRDWSGWKLVSNLPYSVASPILVDLAQASLPPRLVVATLQLEVVQRIIATAGQADYGVLSLLLQCIYQPAGHFKIPAGCFFPEPEIDSGCVILARRERPLLPPDQIATFTRIVKRGFSQRRKMMFKLLKTEWDAGRIEEGFARAGLSVQTRAEAVTLEQFVVLATALHPRR